MGATWSNWSGSVTFTPDEVAHPRSTDDVATLIRKAAKSGRGVRPIGSGHSSTPIMVPEHTLISLDNLTGVEEVTRHGGDGGASPGGGDDVALARVLPGTGLADLGAELGEHGLGMENLGDVDYQAIAGALGTGTHGTGENLGNLSSTLVGGTLVTGSGETRTFGVEAGLGVREAQEDELTRAAQVSLGTLGILTTLTMRVRPAYELHRRNWITHIDWVLENFDALARSHRHVDFYWYPRSDLAQVRVLDEVTEDNADLDPAERPQSSGFAGGLEMPRRHTWLKKEERGPNYAVIPNDRALEFDEMEYMIDRRAGLDVFRQVRERVKERHRANVGWRVLVRTVAPDRALLSNCYERDTMTIALLQNTTLPYQDYFDDMEPVLLDGGGRPHWGKKHTRTGEHLRAMYPEWDTFREWRERLDPDGVLLNDYLRELLEVGA
ncbi:D-arabinono-1,4-lactone oxidase [Bogoriella caseilytica]|uniref:FAD/FMN-containing dehydrogenase n=1 Tax=Bogoriella caseilytica TaxID=56055 RepID=A0A3N2BBH2_9MICO|nr:D-arabinono-1,4-lactone oxidase [Bogoriella caseilytica]ROR72597.1 FAD/FMN-containing dehydrogenase [Bogoriella caseilytica]